MPIYSFFFPPPHLHHSTSHPLPSLTLDSFFLLFLKICLCPNRWRCEIFKHTLLFGDDALQQMGRSCTDPQCMQISIQSSPGCFQYNTSASGLVLIPLYPQPKRCFIQSNALSAMSTWTSGHITEPKKKKKTRCACALGKRARNQGKCNRVNAI